MEEHNASANSTEQQPEKRKFIPGKSPGRPKGSLNRGTRIIKNLAKDIFEDPEYRAYLIEAAKTGKLNPKITVELMHYYAGKPKDTVQVDASDALAKLLKLAIGGTE